jgi:hypothetical protein
MAAVISPEALEDPIGVIAGLVARRDPAMDREVIMKVAESAAGGRAKRRQLAQALLDNPGVLADSRSPAPRAVADLLIALRAAGSGGISPPACAECGRRLPVSVRTPGGPLCQNCRPLPVAKCSSCGRQAPCETSMITGEPRCLRCQQRWAQCSACGKTRPTYGGTLDSSLCLACTRPDISSWHACPACGQGQRIRPGRPCVRCTLRRKLAGLLGSGSGQVRPEFQSLHDSLADVDRPSTALFQLATDLPAAVLARMLGIHITVAVAWQRASAGDWTAYAADVSRRTRTSSPAE